MENNQPIIVKRVKKTAGGHHGGAWKIAFADFATAMMAFFLVMWLMSSASPEQKKLISGYFKDPIGFSESASPYVIDLGGSPTPSPDRTLNPETQEPIDNERNDEAEQGALDAQEAEALAEELERERLELLLQELQNKVEQDPQLQRFKDQILFEITQDGLRIQIVFDPEELVAAIANDEGFVRKRAVACGEVAAVDHPPTILVIADVMTLVERGIAGPVEWIDYVALADQSGVVARPLLQQAHGRSFDGSHFAGRRAEESGRIFRPRTRACLRRPLTRRRIDQRHALGVAGRSGAGRKRREHREGEGSSHNVSSMAFAAASGSSALEIGRPMTSTLAPSSRAWRGVTTRFWSPTALPAGRKPGTTKNPCFHWRWTSPTSWPEHTIPSSPASCASSARRRT